MGRARMRASPCCGSAKMKGCPTPTSSGSMAGGCARARGAGASSLAAGAGSGSSTAMASASEGGCAGADADPAITTCWTTAGAVTTSATGAAAVAAATATGATGTGGPAATTRGATGAGAGGSAATGAGGPAAAAVRGTGADAWGPAASATATVVTCTSAVRTAAVSFPVSFAVSSPAVRVLTSFTRGQRSHGVSVFTHHRGFPRLRGRCPHLWRGGQSLAHPRCDATAWERHCGAAGGFRGGASLGAF